MVNQIKVHALTDRNGESFIKLQNLLGKHKYADKTKTMRCMAFCFVGSRQAEPSARSAGTSEA